MNKCKDCNLEIGWFKDYSGTNWYGCECSARLTKELFEDEN